MDSSNNQVTTEIIETLNDYIFDSYVQCSIPSMMALLDTGYKSTSKINTKNIVNKDKTQLGITSYKPSSYVSIFIPKEYADNSYIKQYIDNKCEIIQDNILNSRNTPLDNADFIPSGNKGDKYIVTFIGGDLNNYQVIGRYNK